MAVQNNTTGASIYDLGKVVQSDSIAALNTTLKELYEYSKIDFHIYTVEVNSFTLFAFGMYQEPLI